MSAKETLTQTTPVPWWLLILLLGGGATSLGTSVLNVAQDAAAPELANVDLITYRLDSIDQRLAELNEKVEAHMAIPKP